MNTGNGRMAILTATEKRVLGLVSRSRTNREIAASLGVSPCTIKRHLENILRKLDARNRVEAAIYGLSMAGCAARSAAECPLEAWRKERDARTE